LFNKIFKTFGVKFSSALLNLLIAVIVSQYLGSGGKGEQGIIITTIAFVLIFSNIVGGASLVYLTPRLPLKKLLLLSYLWTILVSGASACIILLFFPIKALEHTYALHIAILVTINSFAAVNCSILLGKENIKANNIITFFQVFITVIALLALFSSPHFLNINGYLYALYAAYIGSLILSLFFLLPYRTIKTNDEITFSKAIVMLFHYGFLNQLAHITQFLSFRVSYYFLESFSDHKAVGIYSNAVSIIESVWMISSSIAIVQYSKIANSQDNKANQILTAEFVRISLLVTFVVLIPLILLPASFYSFIFGKEFFDINHIMWCLAPGILVFVNALIIGHYFSGSGKYHVNTIGSTVGLVITIILSFLLVPRFGYIGAAVTASISYLATSAFVTWFFCKESQIGFSELLPLPKYFSGYRVMIKEYLYHKNQKPQ
jgi:O-antigen/teichoic acid export membrane protein